MKALRWYEDINMTEFFRSSIFLKFVDIAFYILLIAITAWTVYQILNVPIRERLYQARYRSQVRKAKIATTEVPINKRSPLYRHIYFLLASVKKADTKSQKWTMGVSTFIVLSLLIGFLTFSLILVKYQDAFLGLIIGTVVSIIPYIILHVQLRNTRNAVGNQLTEIVELIIHAYGSSSSDMYQALKVTQSHIAEKELRSILVRLISDLQTARTEEEMRLSIDLFIFTCGNSWSMRLGNIILKSYLHQENVMSALIQLQNQMINNQKMLEQEKASSYDAFVDATLTVILFPISLIGAKFMTKPQSWMALQFGEKATLMLFILTTIMVVISLLVGLIIRKPKNDL
ncbi:hypothetical protein SFC50_02515 [Bacillus infantis]|uniref:hypothetical protein n=2 Tax=Bacillaceae TaxID=186817 RepID=UPI003981DD28